MRWQSKDSERRKNDMKKTIKTIGTIVTITATIISICLFNGVQVEAAEPESIVEVETVTDFEVTENGLQLYFHDGNGYYWKYDDTVIETISNAYVQYDNNLVDMNTVIDFTATEYGLYLYFDDGNGYYWER